MKIGEGIFQAESIGGSKFSVLIYRKKVSDCSLVKSSIVRGEVENRQGPVEVRELLCQVKDLEFNFKFNHKPLKYSM